jgi:acyl dehydratase
MLDHRLARAVFGAVPAPPGLVVNVAIGQSSVFTRRVRANLFYRGLQLHRLPELGETLSTETEVVALRQNRPRAGRAPTGLVRLRVRATDGEGRPVLGFERCAMLALRDPGLRTGHEDDVAGDGDPVDLAGARGLAGGWDLAPLRAAVEGPHADELAPGHRWVVSDGDPVTAAPELARLTLNLAAVHYDARAADSGQRLVFGGHAIGLAAAQATRLLPGLAAVVAWTGCEHLGPVREEDLLTSTLTVEEVSALASTGALVQLRSQLQAQRPDGCADVLDWRFVAVVA